MSDDETGQQPGQTPPQPSWGSAYPPPGQNPPPFPGQVPPPAPGYGYGAPVPSYPAWTPAPPKHPRAVVALVLGIVGVTGIAFCLTVFAAPFAWWLGATAVRDIDANPQAYSGRSEANAGKIMGIIGTVLLGLMLAALIVIIVVAINDPDAFDDSSDYFLRRAFDRV